MLIDWFTVAAQLVNFLILVWLLRRFLYQPVLKAIGEREKKIADELQHAACVEEEAARQKSEWQRKNDDFDKSQGERLRQAAEEVEKKRSALLEEARTEYVDLQTRLREALQKEQLEQQQEDLRHIRSEVFDLAGKVLEELSDTTLQERIVSVFCSRLQASGKKLIGEMAATIREKRLQPVVRSAFELQPGERLRVRETVRKLFTPDLELTYETSGESGAGIELCVDGRCIAWNFETALESLKAISENPTPGKPADKESHDEDRQEKHG
jgi:F-type H+-transporting ATPase subunit b